MVIVRIWEGLGNQMFQYAYARAMQEKGIDVRLDLDKAYDEVFEKCRNNALRSNGIQNFRISIPSINVNEYGKYVYLNRNTIEQKVVFWLGSHSLWRYKFYEEQKPEYAYEKTEMRGNYYVKGWFQSEKYFLNIRPVLLKEFVPRKKIKVSKKVWEAFENPQSISIHIRRGDYVRLNNALNPAYYEKAVHYIKQIYSNPVFMIFSDDLEWVKKYIHIDGRCIYVNEDGRLKDYEELFIMSRSRSNIISNSTFSWWAAWINTNRQKIVIGPKRWGKGIMPEDWVLL